MIAAPTAPLRGILNDCRRHELVGLVLVVGHFDFFKATGHAAPPIDLLFGQVGVNVVRDAFVANKQKM